MTTEDRRKQIGAVESRAMSLTRIRVKNRAQIDSIDDKLVSLLEERMSLVKEIGEAKKRSDTAIYCPAREKEILTRLCRHKGLLGKKAIEAIFLEIFAASRSLEHSERVAFLGPVGSFTHQAAESRFGATGDYLCMQSIGAVFEAVESARAKYGVVPIYNNNSGLVGDTLRRLETSSLLIVGDMELPIHHCFAAKSEKLGAIKRIYSKDAAFEQCAAFLQGHSLENVERIPIESTAKAAKLASEDPEAAAICSHIAAQLLNLPIIFDNIQDSGENKTRFAILSDFVSEPSGSDTTSIIAQTQDKPGALFTLLKEFNDAKINLTQIESLPSKGDKRNSRFFIDFEGHRDDPKPSATLSKIKHYKWLGSYARS
ncbi:MAG: chorismate mutase [Helicobacteraceae bacterium]|jgi:chorismate mutase/prephenate dehydratase|nr:chorismate mutase [Helicobacteraceae bacterium]